MLVYQRVTYLHFSVRNFPLAKALLLQCRWSIKGIQCWHQDGLRQWQTLTLLKNGHRNTWGFQV